MSNMEVYAPLIRICCPRIKVFFFVWCQMDQRAHTLASRDSASIHHEKSERSQRIRIASRRVKIKLLGGGAVVSGVPPHQQHMD